jgi:hypothetical protein
VPPGVLPSSFAGGCVLIVVAADRRVHQGRVRAGS